MKKSRCFAFLLLLAVLITSLCSCLNISNPSGDTDNNNSSTPSAEESTDAVSQQHINFILNRNVFVADFDYLYSAALPDYKSSFDTDIQLRDLISSTYFYTSSIKWEYGEATDGVITVYFTGVAKGVGGDTAVAASFYWGEDGKLAFVSGYIIGTDVQNRAQVSIDSLRASGYALEDAILACDAMFSCMLASLLIEIPEQTPPSEGEGEQISQNHPSVQEQSYAEGLAAQANGNYILAISKYEEAGSYKDAEERLLLCIYLQGETLYENGQYLDAVSHYLAVPSYQDAPYKIKACYYEMGKYAFSEHAYLDAADYFLAAGDHSDAATLVLECYYLYGKIQMSLQYTTTATEYLSLCRGYKDTDEILLSFYYGQAATAYNAFIEDCAGGYSTDQKYSTAKESLLLCEDYKDSTTMLRVVETLYTAYKQIGSLTDWYYAHWSDVSASASGSNVFIQNDGFMGSGTLLNLKTDVEEKTFSASISNIFTHDVQDYGARKAITALVLLFSDISDTTDLSAKIADKSNWTCAEDNETFSASYGGYTVYIEATAISYNYINCFISVSRLP